MSQNDCKLNEPVAAPDSPPNGMKYSKTHWTIAFGSVAGVNLHVHISFPIAIIAIYLVPLKIGGGSLPLAILITSLSLFAHEIAHALTAKRYGTRITSVVLYPLRAVVVADGGQLDPPQALLILAAGPAASISIALLVWGGLALAGGPFFSAAEPHKLAFASLSTRVVLINSLVAAVNLLPALPFDGGRALLVVLTRRMEQTKAIAAALQVSLLLSCGLGVLALTTHVFALSLLGVLITLGATREAQLARNQPLDLHAVTARSLMDEEGARLTSGESATRAATSLKGCPGNVFPVLQGSELAGLVSRLSLARGLARRGAVPYVAELMSRNYTAVPATLAATEALVLLSRSPLGAIVVLHEGVYAGLITAGSVRKFLAARSAVQNPAKTEAASAQSRRDGA